MRQIILISFIFLCLFSVCLTRDPSKILRDVCKNDPNLKEFDGTNKGYEEIDEDAFQGCENLDYIDLQDNNWQVIPRNVFKDKGLSKLEQLWITGGKIPIFDLDFTDLKQLKTLSLNNLNITSLPSKTFEGLTKLESLAFHINRLCDIDIEGILEFTPNLWFIFLSDNNYKCSRLEEIISYIRNKNVSKLTSTTWELRVRNYTPQKIEDIECLDDEQWQAECTTDE